MKYSKRFLAFLLATLICVFSGCSGGAAPATEAPASDLKLTSEYVIVTPKDADGTTNDAAKLLQVTLGWKLRLDPKIVTSDPGEKAIVVAVDDSMAQGQYEFKIKGTSLYITASESHVLLYVVKLLRQALLDSGKPNLVTVSTCQSLCATVDTQTLPFTFITQNILYMDGEGRNTIAERAPRFRDMVLEYQPDIVGLQESNTNWESYYANYFGDTYFAINHANVNILFRTDRYELVENGFFYLSPTPDVRSQFEGDSGPRSCCWAIVKDLVTEKELLVCTPHLDWNNDTQRALQLEVLIEQMTPYFEKYPSILCGDFNSPPEGPIYARVCEIFTDSRVSAARNISEVNFTAHGFGQKMSFIDYIFHSPDFQADLYYILSDDYGGYVSDHYGVLTNFSFAK